MLSAAEELRLRSIELQCGGATLVFEGVFARMGMENAVFDKESPI